MMVQDMHLELTFLLQVEMDPVLQLISQHLLELSLESQLTLLAQDMLLETQ